MKLFDSRGVGLVSGLARRVADYSRKAIANSTYVSRVEVVCLLYELVLLFVLVGHVLCLHMCPPVTHSEHPAGTGQDRTPHII
jgi:hypothetical protein